MNRLRSAAVLVTTLAAAACTGARSDAPALTSPPSVREIPTPAAPGSGEPNLTVAPDGRVLLSWIEPADDGRYRLRFASRAAGGEWGAPRTIAEGKDWFVNWADFPALAVAPDGTLFAHWLAKRPGGRYSYDVRVTISRDGGATWGAPLTPHRDGKATEHGFVSFFPEARNRIGLVWLDGRNLPAAERHEGHEASAGSMALLHTTIGADGTLGPETVLDDRVCDCCQTGAAVAEGAVVVAYRDRSEAEVRDMSIVRRADGGWTSPAPLAADGWQINGCPVNGPAVAAAGRRAAVAWFTSASDTPRVNVAFSSDAGGSFGSPIPVDDGRAVGRVDVALLAEGDALVSWLEQGGKGAELRVRRVSAAGRRGEAVTIADSSAARSSGFPRLETSGGEAVFAWRDPADPPRVRTAVLPIR